MWNRGPSLKWVGGPEIWTIVLRVVLLKANCSQPHGYIYISMCVFLLYPSCLSEGGQKHNHSREVSLAHNHPLLPGGQFRWDCVTVTHIPVIPVLIFIPFLALRCVLCRHECKGSDPEGVWPVQTEDLHRLHTLERRGELHRCVQRQRVRSQWQLWTNLTCQMKCFLYAWDAFHLFTWDRVHGYCQKNRKKNPWKVIGQALCHIRNRWIRFLYLWIQMAKVWYLWLIDLIQSFHLFLHKRCWLVLPYSDWLKTN